MKFIEVTGEIPSLGYTEKLISDVKIGDIFCTVGIKTKKVSKLMRLLEYRDNTTENGQVRRIVDIIAVPDTSPFARMEEGARLVSYGENTMCLVADDNSSVEIARAILPPPFSRYTLETPRPTPAANFTIERTIVNNANTIVGTTTWTGVEHIDPVTII